VISFLNLRSLSAVLASSCSVAPAVTGESAPFCLFVVDMCGLPSVSRLEFVDLVALVPNRSLWLEELMRFAFLGYASVCIKPRVLRRVLAHRFSYIAACDRSCKQSFRNFGGCVKVFCTCLYGYMLCVRTGG
jgi:hypothetical protein